jgi:iron complex outermembrane receptor protein
MKSLPVEGRAIGASRRAARPAWRLASLAPAVALLSTTALTSTEAQAQAQSSTGLPTIVVESSRQQPRAVRSGRPARTPAVALAPSEAVEAKVEPGYVATLSGDAIASRALGTSDSGALIGDIPGGAAWGAGGVSSLPAINGLGADRVQVAINSMLISPACPNEMNPPLSFVNPQMIAKLQTYYGVAPVSVGGDYIGGKIDVTTAPPQFAQGPGWLTSGSVSGFFRSNGNAYGVNASATLANKDTSVTYTGGWAKAGDYHAADGTKVKSTLYEIQNHALSISRQSFGNLFTVQVGGQFIPYQGFVNQRMDLVYNQSAFVNGRYEGLFDWGKLDASGFYHQVNHTMGFIAPDKTGNMPMDTKARDAGYTLKATIDASPQDVVRIGNELYHNRLNDWWDPVAGSMMMSPNVFININDGTRTRLGTFVEWEHRWNREWTTVAGLRNDMVWSNTGPVQGYNMMSYGADAAAFNARDRARTDVNLDGSALLRYEPNQIGSYELGLARKTRSPNLYERYAWSTNSMAMNMNGWFGDGNGYIGNVDLEPEKAHTVSFTAGWHDPAQKVWELKVTPYYSYVQDYIDVKKCATSGMGMMLTVNCNGTSAVSNNFVYLKFINQDAQLYGVNIAGKLALWDDLVYGRGVFRGTFGYVRGHRTDGIDLYHIMPINAKLALDHTLGAWTNSVELQLVGSKDDVSQVRNELTTPSYALLNLRTGYQWQSVRVDAGIDNLFNKYYDLPLGGADLVDFNKAWGNNVPGAGRSYNGRLTVTF